MVNITVPKSIARVRIKHLTAPEGAYANSTLTWGGAQWNYPSGQEEWVTQQESQMSVGQGKLSIAVNATEAVMLYLSSSADAVITQEGQLR